MSLTHARLSAQRITVLSLVTALVLSMLTIFSAPSAFAEERGGERTYPQVQTDVLPNTEGEGAEPVVPADGQDAAPDASTDQPAPPVPGVDGYPVERDQPASHLAEPEVPATPRAEDLTFSQADDSLLSGTVTLPSAAAGDEPRWFASLVVTAWSEAEGSYWSAVDESGAFAFADLPEGDFSVRVESSTSLDPEAVIVLLGPRGGTHSCCTRTVLPAGSRNAKSRVPQS